VISFFGRLRLMLDDAALHMASLGMVWYLESTGEIRR